MQYSQEIRAFAESERVAVLSAEAAVALELPVSREMEMVANVDPQVSAGHVSSHQIAEYKLRTH